MKRAAIIFTLSTALGVAGLEAQAVPENSPATKVPMGYRRTPSIRLDPFRMALIPHWGMVFSVGGTSENNTFNLSDIGAVTLLDDQDKLLIGDFLDLVGLVPGGGFSGGGQAGGKFTITGAVGEHFSFSLAAGGSGYGSFRVDDDFVALLRDGNGARQDFTLGNSRGAGLGTGEIGAHLVYRTNPISSVDGVQLAFGAGARFVRPIAYAQTTSLLDNGGVIQVTGTTVNASIDVEVVNTIFGSGNSLWDRASGGSGSLVGDFLVRAEWPSQGFAFEAMLANVGNVTVAGVERRRLTLDVASTNLTDVSDALDTLDLVIQDTMSVDLALPRIWKLTATAWANRYLQIDFVGSMPVGGTFETPGALDIMTTWRFVPTLPLRAGVILGGYQGVGYMGGFSIESRNLLFQVAAQSLGGLFSDARGLGARLDLGFFF